jgi:uncharacterized membrane protein YeaQ/YmgE (transglycosylase-associated protein family)
MFLIGFILFMCITGAIVGGLARLALPGPDPMSVGETIAIGIGGSFLGGILFRLLFGRPAGLIGSVLVATGLVYLVRRSRAQSGPRY